MVAKLPLPPSSLPRKRGEGQMRAAFAPLPEFGEDRGWGYSGTGLIL